MLESNRARLRPSWIIGTLRSDNGDGDGNVRSLGRAGPRRVGVPAKIEITNFTSENVDDGHWCLSCLSQRKFFRKPCQSSVTLFSWLMLEGRGVWNDDFLNWKGLLYVYSLRDWMVFFVQWRFMQPSVSLFLHILSVTSPLVRAVLSPKTPTRV